MYLYMRGLLCLHICVYKSCGHCLGLKEVIWGPQKLGSSHVPFRTFPAIYPWKDDMKTKWWMAHSLLAELNISVSCCCNVR